jgi:hypothetical protein
MLALSIRQPWAHLIIAGVKRIENRNWRTSHRGPIAIHAARRVDPIAPIAAQYGVIIPSDLLRGGIIGVADLVDIVQQPQPEDEMWFDGPFGWVLRNARPVPFVATRGVRGRLFDVAAAGECTRGCGFGGR